MLARQVGDLSASLGLKALSRGRWREALDYADQAKSSAPQIAAQITAQASFRLARRAVLRGDFSAARQYAETAVALCPGERSYQYQLTAIRRAAGRVLRESNQRFFPDTVGSSSGRWWGQDLLSAVRGWDGQGASVEAPLIMRDIRREHLDDIYALGTYRPWHDGIPPRYTQYIRELKRHGRTVAQAAILLRQGLTGDTESRAPDWIEDIDVVVPMATGWRSFEARDGLEITEALAEELAALLCVPFVDVFERDPDAGATHHLGGYRARLDALVDELRVKNIATADLAGANGVLIVDDVVTYGATFEACARRLREAHPHLRCYGAALAYTQTQGRLETALAERSAAADDESGAHRTGS